MKILVIGGVAAGTKAAAKWKRENRADQVVLLTKSADISYAGCGLPYYVGGSIENREELIVNTPQKYRGLTGVEVLTLREATHVDPAAKVVTVQNLENGQEETYGYDKLIVATGASAVKLPLPGVDLNGVFPMRAPEDAITMRDYLEANGVKKAVVIGGGFIGLELAENLFDRGIAVTVVEVASQILSGVLDGEMAGYVQRHLQQKGIRVLTGTKATALVGDGKVEGVQTDAGLLPCGAVVVSAGIRPNTAFLEGTGIQMEKGAIVVDECLATSVADIYAAGDCALVKNRLTGKAQYSPMGSSANLEGRTLAQNLNGENKTYPGVLGTGVVKLPGLNVGRTGLTESAAKEAGYDVETVVAVTDDKAHYYPGAAFFITKLLADRNTHQLLGVQVLGPGAVDKMVDIAVVGLSMGLKLEDFENLDLAYAPPFSTAIHPFVQAVYVLENKLSGAMQSMTPAQYAAGAAEGYTVIDVNPQPTIRGAKFVDLSQVEGPIEMRAITEAAERFGNGQVAMTTRLTIEIQHIPFDNIEPLREFLAQHGLETGGTGSKVRPVVSCKGTTCQYGLIDTFALSEEIHERFYHGYNDVKLPHKFKIAVGGCPNNCVKPDLNDLGIIGQKVPRIDLDKCRGCKVCQVEKACPIQVPVVQDGKVVIDDSACNHCGRCVGKCPFKAVEGFTSGYRVYIGGRWGKKVAHGRYLEKVFTDKDEVLGIVEKAILLFREQGLTGERFADTVERIGFENVQEQLLSDGLLQRKEENLKLNVKGGATC